MSNPTDPAHNHASLSSPLSSTELQNALCFSTALTLFDDRSKISTYLRDASSELKAYDNYIYTNTFGFGFEWKSTTCDLAAVCSRWREIVIDCPALWSLFSVALDIPSVTSHPTKLFLERSRAHPHPLHLRLSGDGINGSFDEGQLLDLVVLHAHQWASLTLNDVELGYNSPFPGFPRLCLASLIKYDAIHLSDHLKNASDLRALTLAYTQEDWEDLFRFKDQEAVPFERIEDLTVEHGEDWSVQATVHTLERSSSIRSLTYKRSSAYASFEHDAIYLRNGPYDGTHLFPWSYLKDREKAKKPGSSCSPLGWLRSEWPGQVIRTSLGLDGFEGKLTTLKLMGMPLATADVLDLLRYTLLLEDFTLHESWTGPDATQRPPPPPPPSKSSNSTKKPKFNGLCLEPGSHPNLATVTKAFLEALMMPEFYNNAFAVQSHHFLSRLRHLRLKVQDHFDADVEFVQMVLSRTSELLEVEERLRTVELVVLGRELDTALYEPLKRVEREDGVMVTVVGSGVYVV
ncbi:hypothetical protein V5O48_009634 [Marasmius crinis-equi]|uniref:F-box domain-containing protein n=1 Tax=Marasmius crinis-equi TaxID=585013 RepID=A0ABR3FAJ8_9AGAR